MDCTFEGPRVGLFFFLLYLARVEQHCLDVLYFLGLWREQAFVGFFFFFNVRTYWHFHVAFFFSSQSGVYEAQRKSQRTHHLVIP